MISSMSLPKNAGVNNILHPIVLIEIADQNLRHVHRHHLATKASLSSAAASSASSSSSSSSSITEIPCVGMVFGVRKENDCVEIFSSIEAKVNEAPSGSSLGTQFTVDESLISIHTKLTTQVFPSYELLGWYAAATSFSPALYSIHEQFRKFSKNPILLLVSPSKISEGTRELPVKLLQERDDDSSMVITSSSSSSSTTATTTSNPETIEMKTSSTKFSFVQLPYRLDAAEHERICIDHVTSSDTMRNKRGSDSTPAMIELRSQATALKVLSERIHVLQAFVGACEQGQIPVDGISRPILRQISGLCARRPIVAPDDSEHAFQRAQNQEDSLMIALVASVTKGVQSLSSIAEKLSVIHSAEKRGQRSGPWGLGDRGDREMTGNLMMLGGGGGVHGKEKERRGRRDRGGPSGP